ncbi:DUF488 domain-containing protein [Echinicola rosea]|uniref:DUF488 domain-containing protein n=1 Tax=Echinicola rosea TaxID=1807691 RepID=UPI001E43D35F|nr:DUF488 domain-containing protein [Echinicola rosea]
MIELLGGEVEKLRLQKLLFLYTEKKPQAEYDFIPYKYGCYSYSAKADVNTMIKKGYLIETENKYSKMDTYNYFEKLKQTDATLLQQVVSDYGQMSSNALIKHTYLNFPFYAIRSTIANEILPGQLYERIEKAMPKDEETTLFTIGYEGISLEKYLQKLVKNNVKLLVDVRKNPLSMKFGFSKTLLKRYCNSLGIEYLHIPEVGINSDKRQKLEVQADYDRLFADYKKTTLSETSKSQEQILGSLRQYKRIALTCFEAEPCQCHRSHLAEALMKSPDFSYSLKHL